MRIALLALAVLAVAGCTDSTSEAPPPAGLDAQAEDQGSTDAQRPDATARSDLGLSDMGADLATPDTGTDVGVDDLGAPDRGSSLDAAPADLGEADAGACNDTVLDSVILECPSGYEYARVVGTRPVQRGCPDEILLSGTRYPDLPSAIAGAACNQSCVWRASMSVSFVDHCNRRNGYIIFRARGCDDLYEFSNGLFPSVMAWTQATPCP